MADGIMNKDQLLSLTLRQLRQEASKLSVPLYSRKTKAVLVDLILKYQENSTKKTYTLHLLSQNPKKFLSSQRILTTVQKDTQFPEKKNILIPNKNGDFKVPEGIMNKDQLLSLTLRQLRQEASKLLSLIHI